MQKFRPAVGIVLIEQAVGAEVAGRHCDRHRGSGSQGSHIQGGDSRSGGSVVGSPVAGTFPTGALGVVLHFQTAIAAVREVRDGGNADAGCGEALAGGVAAAFAVGKVLAAPRTGADRPS